MPFNLDTITNGLHDITKTVNDVVGTVKGFQQDGIKVKADVETSDRTNYTMIFVAVVCFLGTALTAFNTFSTSKKRR
jgi:hypothetical protein